MINRIKIGDMGDIGGNRNTNGSHGVSADDHEEHFYFWILNIKGVNQMNDIFLSLIFFLFFVVILLGL